MALVAQATKISVAQSIRPSGITDPGGTIPTSSNPDYANLEILVDKTTVEDAVEGTTFDNIRTDGVVGIEAQIAAIVGGDFDDTANTVTYTIDWKKLDTNQQYKDKFYTNDAVEYKCVVDVYVVIS